MTNSIASSKCLPPVLTSGNYGMSQNRHIDESKEYIFVKLTDSAYRAVEEYQRNEHAKRFGNGQCAKIQLIGNSGVIHFPTPDNAEGRKFGFAIDEIEGSLECIQQTQNELDVLGSLPLRMRIHANDDVYDTTRTKMAIAEETEKSKCIREIKPNQTDIGRKVKKPALTATTHSGGNGYHRDSGGSNNHAQAATSSSNSFLSNSNNRSKLVALNNSSSPSNGAASTANFGNSSSSSKHTSSSRSPNPSLLGGSTTTGSSNRYNSPHNNPNLYGSSNSNPSSLTTASSLSSVLTAGLHQTTHSSSCSNGYSSASSGSPPEGSSKSAKMSLGTGARSTTRPSLVGGTGGSQSSKSGSGVTSSKLPDISKRKLRERLIHLLALKPFKKPELYARLANEGIRDKDRLSIGNTLKDIATLSRDNTYNLKRPMWNDVNENWPFYTEQEAQQLKRRKPQNLTPPLSSDAGSSTSGQSPTSTHTGSPPPLVGNHSGSMKRASLERDPYEDGSMTSGMQAKKQRISHFKKDGHPITSTSCTGGGTNPRLTYGNSNSYGQHSIVRSSATSYSPHGSSVIDSENPNNTDLSYNVLDNVDDFMPHVEQQGSGSSYFGAGSGNNSNSRKHVSSNKTTTSTTNLKEKRSGAGLVQQPQERTSNKELMMKKKLPASPTPYGSNFVPEKSSSSRGSSANNCQRQSPSNNSSFTQQQQHNKTSNSVIFSPKMQTQASPRDEFRTSSCGNNNSSNSSSRYNQQQQQQQQTKSSRASATTNQSRTPTPPAQQQQSQHYQENNAASNHQHSAQQTSQTQHQPQSPPQQQLHSSPTQQIAAAVSSYAAASSQSSQKHYDFSNYTPITSIEQRRHYKTEFESDYDEYRKLLAQVEGVSMRFRGLAERLENTHKGCPDYYNIKQQIVSEYDRIRNEEAVQREKQRFDYLHEKLAHIKQLVTDYDKTLTSASVVHQQQQQHLIQQQQKLQCDSGVVSQTAPVSQTNSLTRNSRVSPMVGENSHSPTVGHYQQQHHAAETIQQTQQEQHKTPHYNELASTQTTPPDSDTDDSSDSNDDDDESNDADSHDDGIEDDEDDDIDTERY